MALDAARRASIYEKLRPVLGDEDANVLMSEFPSVEAHELVTKDFLRAELALTNGELRAELANFGGQLRAEMTGLRGEMAAGDGGLRGEMTTMGADLRVEMAGLRTDMAELKTALTVRVGAAIAASTALQLTALSVLT